MCQSERKGKWVEEGDSSFECWKRGGSLVGIAGVMGQNSESVVTGEAGKIGGERVDIFCN